MRRLPLVLLSFFLIALLVACGADSAPVVETIVDQTATLPVDYDDALSRQAQLALGTIQLQESELAVDQAQAETLLPLWEALSALSNSDTTATAELDAVVRQIERAMTPEQIAAIADMSLTTSSMADLQASGELALGGFGGRGGAAAGENGTLPDGLPAGGIPGGRGGGLGGGQGGGPGGGGAGGLGTGEIDADTLATRQAQFAGGNGSLEDTVLLAAVTRLLRTTTGEVTIGGGTIGTIWTTISGLLAIPAETLQAELADGVTPAEIISAHGGSVDDVRAAVLATLADSSPADPADLEQFVDDFLNGGAPGAAEAGE